MTPDQSIDAGATITPLLPAAWGAAHEVGIFEFRADSGARHLARVMVHSASCRADQLLDRVGGHDATAVRRPTVQTLPEECGDGNSVVRFHEVEGRLVARVDMVCRADGFDTVLRAQTGDLADLDALFSAMLDLLRAVRVAEADAFAGELDTETVDLDKEKR